jgi:hypothetical protein
MQIRFLKTEQFIMSEHTALDIHFVLGKYKTKKRCLEVLDEIQKNIDNHGWMHESEGTEKWAAVYQMPEK